MTKIKLQVGRTYILNSGARIVITRWHAKHDVFEGIEEQSKVPIAAVYNPDGRIQLDTAWRTNPLTIVTDADDKRTRYFCQFPDGRLFGPPCSPVSWPDYPSAVQANAERIAKGRAKLIPFREG